MAFTELEEIRLLINDPSDGTGNPTATTSRFTDTQINNVIAKYDSGVERVLNSAATLCRMIAAISIEGSVSKNIGGTFNYDRRKIFSFWNGLAKEYAEAAANQTPLVSIIELATTTFARDELLVDRNLRDRV